MANEVVTRPLLHPVLLLRKDPVKQVARGGGKSEEDIVSERLDRQRVRLARELRALGASSAELNVFGDQVILVAEMFDDSFASSRLPKDLFLGRSGTLVRGPAAAGYFLEVPVSEIPRLERRVEQLSTVAVKCDVSRVKSVRAFSGEDVLRGRTVRAIWDEGVEVDGGRVFTVWLTPFRDEGAQSELLAKLQSLRDDQTLLPVPARSVRAADGALLPDTAERSSSFAIAQRNYRTGGRARATFRVRTEKALAEIVASGGVFRLEPTVQLVTTAPGVGEEPGELPAFITSQPIVAVVDGGCTARRYKDAEAWREVPFVGDGKADAHHGNLVTSAAIHGHEWNNNLALPELYCRVGVAQAIAKLSSGYVYDVDRLASYLDDVMSRHTETRVWNVSWNQLHSADATYVSDLGHELAKLSRKHGALFVVSAGNVSNTKGTRIAPPADCEAALVVGGRQYGSDGRVAAFLVCPVESGPSPELGLAHF